MEHVGKTLSGPVAVYDVMFTDTIFSSYSAFHGTAHVWTPGCHGAHSFSHFLYEYLLFVILPPINQALLWSNIPHNRNHSTAGRNLTYRISIKPLCGKVNLHIYVSSSFIWTGWKLLLVSAKIFNVNFGKMVFNGLDADTDTDGQTWNSYTIFFSSTL